ncbi:MAG: gamma-glutamyltransferase [Acidimicrobiia bacterium]|nr:gamma-glutamyltransferase [Acidimicrobiia bacterium]
MRRVATSASTPLAADVAAAVADDGGNAVDAAIASTVVAMVTQPGIIGPGAGTFVTVWPAGGEPVVVDAYAAKPGLGLPDGRRPQHHGDRVWMDYGGGMHTLVGHASVAVPGVFSGLGLASERYGALPWRDVIEPSIRVVREGFPYSAVSAAYLAYAHEPIYDREADSFAALHRSDGSPLDEGEPVVIEHLADSLEIIAEEGPHALLTGSLGERMAADMAARGGWITAEDLTAYRPIVREPIRVPVDEWEVATNPPPAVGGATLAAMLLLLDDHPFREWTAPEVAHLAQVERAVLRYRAEVLDRSADRAAEAAHLLDRARVGDLRGLLGSPSTVHQSTVDTDGLACAITTSAGYGSGVMIPESGFWLNNSLGEIDLHPDGLEDLAAGDRLPSNMAPTLARRDDGAVLSIGSPGASRITTAIAQVLLNFIHLGMSLSDAVAHPRVHAEVFEGVPTLAAEPGLDTDAVVDLAVRRFPDLSMYFGGVGVVLWDPRAGMFPASDPRRTGAVSIGGR